MEQLLIFLSVLASSYPFNLDTKSPYIVKSETPGYFGYSVALHRNDDGNFLLVGAPTTNTSQPGVVQGGTVYKCKVPDVVGDPTDSVICSEQLSILDNTGNKYVGKGDLEGWYEFSYNKTDKLNLQLEQKSHQWLGVTIQSDLESNYLIGCAHRYEARYLLSEKYHPDPPRQLTGRCTLLDEFFEDMGQIYEPCKGVEPGLEEQGNCQAGTSAFLHDNKFVMGGPGCYKGSGCLYVYDTDDFMPEMKTNQLAFEDPEYLESLRYTGYSSTMCDLNDDGEQDLISGGPRGKGYRGQVVIYQSGQQLKPVTSNQLPIKFVGEQMGSYYGASLLCQDMNGDGIADLVVGAPWYSLYPKQGQGQPDTGRVYFYPGSKRVTSSEFFPSDYDMSSIQTITGAEEAEAFGFALSTAGDVNNDGTDDLLIGSPYFNDGEGKVSLFLGSKEGRIRTTPSQVITPKTLTLSILDSLQGFGWSIAGGKDMDNNGIPDVLIGSFKSQHAVLLRSVPIIDVNTTIIAMIGNNVVTELDPDADPTIDVPGAGKVQGINLQACFEYAGASGSDQTTEEAAALVKFQITLDSAESFSHARLYINYTNPTQVYEDQITVALTGQINTCTDIIPVYYRGIGIGHTMKPIEFTMAAELDEKASFAHRATLNQQKISDAKLVLNIASDCPPDTGICLTEMALKIGQVQYDKQDRIPLAIGLVDEIKVPIQVLNKGPHTAYGSKLQIDSIPGLLPFIPSKDCNSTYTSELEDEDPYSITCTLPEDVKVNESLVRNLEFNLTRIASPRQFNILVLVTVLEPSVIIKNDNATFSIDVKNLAQLEIRGGSTQGRLPYNNKYGVANKALGYQGPTVRHMFEVSLSHLSNEEYVNSITVSVYWPQKFPDGNWLFPLSKVKVQLFGQDTQAKKESKGVSCDYHNLLVTNWDLLSDAFDGNDIIYEDISCKKNRTFCDKITCKVDYLERGVAGLRLTFYTRVEEYFLYGFGELTVESFAELVSVEERMTLPKVVSTSAQTTLFPSISKSRDMLWIIIVAVICALLILALIFFLLWKMKFFKRGMKLPEPEPPMVVAYAHEDE